MKKSLCCRLEDGGLIAKCEVNMKARISRESELLYQHKQYFLAGFYEEKHAPLVKRYARALRRFLEHREAIPHTGTRIYPIGECNLWHIPDEIAGYSYSFSIFVDQQKLAAIIKTITDPFDHELMQRIAQETTTYTANPLPPKYAIGGAGYTHSIINYRRMLAEGLAMYRKRLENKLREQCTPGQNDLFRALLETIDAIMAFHAKCLAHLKEQQKPSPDERRAEIIGALEQVPMQPARNFHEALVSFTFMWHVDGCDSIGRFDQWMYPYYRADFAAGRITVDAAKEMLIELWKDFDAHSGWHMILGGSDHNGKAAYNDFTRLCLETLHGMRRPNTGLRIRPDMPADVWDAMFDSLLSSSGNPALYNENAYIESVRKYMGVSGNDLYDFAFGGCTETMFDGLSNVGSTEAGINLLDVLSSTICKSLSGATSFVDFLAVYKNNLRAAANEVADEINVNQHMKAVYRPQLIRTLFIDDCIDRGIEYNAGGARYNGCVCNVVGLANAANSLFVVKQLFDGTIRMDKEQFLAMLDADYAGYENIFEQIRHFDKYGNSKTEVDAIAGDIADFVFSEMLKYRQWRANGFIVPTHNIFTTFDYHGKYIPATPDGRKRGEPIADSIGPMQGTDIEGPTAMLLSTGGIPQMKGAGTLVLNLRLDARFLREPESRRKVKELIQGYFNLGGMQIQLTVVDAELLADACKHPGKHPNLIIRIGGYTEYFDRLSDDLKREVLKRTAHIV